MWCIKLGAVFSTTSKLSLLLGLGLISACTVEPLNSSTPDSQISSNVEASTIKSILASTSVKPVTTRVGQQVRNQLLFAMNGGKLKPGGQYSVKLSIKSSSYNLSIDSSSNAPTSAQVAISSTYQLISSVSGKTVASGKRRALSSYDRTSQSFANERAERDAQNRAAKELAQQLRLAIAQSLANL